MFNCYSVHPYQIPFKSIKSIYINGSVLDDYLT